MEQTAELQLPRTDRYATIGCAMAGIAALVTVLAVLVSHESWVTQADHAVTTWFVSHRSAPMNTAVLVLTYFGSPVVVDLVALVLAVAWWRRHQVVGPSLLLLGTVGITGVANSAIKLIVSRQRPPVDIQLMTETSHSYPSGHVAGTVALMGALLLVYRGGIRPSLVAVAILFSVLIALTRLYLGVHWLSDTVGGALVGTFFVLSALLVAQLARQRMTLPAMRRMVLPENAPQPRPKK